MLDVHVVELSLQLLLPGDLELMLILEKEQSVIGTLVQEDLRTVPGFQVMPETTLLVQKFVQGVYLGF
jgi:hypothetical protein